MVQLAPTIWVLFIVAVVLAGLFDIRERRVPNWLVAAVLATGLAGQGLGGGARGLLAGGLGLMCGLGLLFIPFAKGWLGAGDVKLMAAMGAWLGPLVTFEAVLAGTALGGLLSVGCLLAGPRAERHRVWATLLNGLLLRKVPSVDKPQRGLAPPYAVALGAGAVAALVFNWARI